jgi:hypothetical protein
VVFEGHDVILMGFHWLKNSFRAHENRVCTLFIYGSNKINQREVSNELNGSQNGACMRNLQPK